jgi:hypothetical protein
MNGLKMTSRLRHTARQLASIPLSQLAAMKLIVNQAYDERPAPRRMMTLIEASLTARLIAVSNSSGIGGTMVLSSFGRLSVIVAIGPSLV